MPSIILNTGLLLLLGLSSVWALTPDYGRESGFAQLLEGADGELIELETADRIFVNLWQEAERSSDEVIIILHARGLHADWKNNTRPLRLGLAEAGRNTFSVQLPILPKGAGFSEYVHLMPFAAKRLDAVFHHLEQQGFKKIHLVAHSCGAQMAMYWLDQGPKNLDSVTLISMGSGQYLKHFGAPHPLQNLKLPVLDLYGEKDFVAKRAPQRGHWIQQYGHPKSKQIEVENGKHMLKRHHHRMVTEIDQWLDQL